MSGGWLRRIVPESARAAWRDLRLVRRAGRLAREAAAARGPADWLDLVRRYDDFSPLQVREEILGLVEAVAALRPARVCEIGPYLGGTSFLFARAAAPGATLLLVDRHMARARQRALRRLALPGQRLLCIEGDSHGAPVKSRVTGALGGAPLDFLFIDGDHSYEGVAADWRDYAPLVRPGGLVAFHDIVPDHRARYGRETVADSGGVPTFWKELRARHGSAAREIVADAGQDGCGIGLISVGPEPRPGA